MLLRIGVWYSIRTHRGKHRTHRFLCILHNFLCSLFLRIQFIHQSRFWNQSNAIDCIFYLDRFCLSFVGKGHPAWQLVVGKLYVLRGTSSRVFSMKDVGLSASVLCLRFREAGAWIYDLPIMDIRTASALHVARLAPTSHIRGEYRRSLGSP